MNEFLFKCEWKFKLSMKQTFFLFTKLSSLIIAQR